MAQVEAIGIEVPADFPLAAYHVVHARLRDHQKQHPTYWKHYAGGWNGVASRFAMASAANDRLVESIRAHESPDHETRQFQEENLFVFFVAGLATIDSFIYAAFAVCGILQPESFPLNTTDDARKVKIELLRERLSRFWPQSPLTQQIDVLGEDAGFRRWRDIRNILAHRTLPPRHHFAGSDPENLTEWDVAERIPMGVRMTADFRAWLSSATSECVATLASFVEANFH